MYHVIVLGHCVPFPEGLISVVCKPSVIVSPGSFGDLHWSPLRIAVIAIMQSVRSHAVTLTKNCNLT